MLGSVRWWLQPLCWHWPLHTAAATGTGQTLEQTPQHCLWQWSVSYVYVYYYNDGVLCWSWELVMWQTTLHLMLCILAYVLYIVNYAYGVIRSRHDIYHSGMTQCWCAGRWTRQRGQHSHSWWSLSQGSWTSLLGTLIWMRRITLPLKVLYNTVKDQQKKTPVSLLKINLMNM